jgi:hypothetical protein
MLSSRFRIGGGSIEAWQRRGLRALLALTLGVLLLLGVRDVVRPFVGGRATPPAAADPTAAFPREAAEALAVRFAMAYLSFDSSHSDTRRRALQPYLADGADASVGWDGQGRQTAMAGLPSGITVHDARRAQVLVVVLVDGGRWVSLAVPVVVDGDQMAIGGPPVLVPARARASVPTPAQAADQDQALSNQLRPYLSAFLRAYAQSNQVDLAYYAAPGAQLAGLGGQVTLASLVSLSVEQAAGSVRSVVVSVRWQDQASGAGLTQRYRLQLVEAGGKWLVGAINPDESGR